MPTAEHSGGPAHGRNVQIDAVTQTRFWAPAEDRRSRGWVDLARYVFVPPRVGKHCAYRWTGLHQVVGPVPGGKDAPEWSS